MIGLGKPSGRLGCRGCQVLSCFVKERLEEALGEPTGDGGGIKELFPGVQGGVTPGREVFGAGGFVWPEGLGRYGLVFGQGDVQLWCLGAVSVAEQQQIGLVGLPGGLVVIFVLADFSGDAIQGFHPKGGRHFGHKGECGCQHRQHNHNGRGEFDWRKEEIRFARLSR